MTSQSEVVHSTTAVDHNINRAFVHKTFYSRWTRLQQLLKDKNLKPQNWVESQPMFQLMTPFVPGSSLSPLLLYGCLLVKLLNGSKDQGFYFKSPLSPEYDDLLCQECLTYCFWEVIHLHHKSAMISFKSRFGPVQMCSVHRVLPYLPSKGALWSCKSSKSCWAQLCNMKFWKKHERDSGTPHSCGCSGSFRI